MEKNTAIPLLVLFINFSQCGKRGMNYLPLQTRPVIEGEESKEGREQKTQRERERFIDHYQGSIMTEAGWDNT